MRILVKKLTAYAMVFFAIIVLIVVTIGATGVSDSIVGSVVNEEMRGLRQSLAQSIRDPDELERVLRIRQKELEDQYGLNTPWYVRMPKDVVRIAQLDLGEAKTLRTFSGSSKTSDIILERLPNTLVLMVPSFLFVTLLGLTFGAWSAAHAGSRRDRILSIFSVSTIALPAWGVGILLIMIFAEKLGILPSGLMYSAPPPEDGLLRSLDLVKHAVLPVASLSLASVGMYLLTIRNTTLTVSQEPFVMYARLRGLPEGRVRRRYILRPAAPPIVTNIAFGLLGLFGGAIITEKVFSWPGMGQLFADATFGTFDEGIVVGLTIIYAAMFLVTRLILDYVYVWLDPKVRL